MLVKRKTALIFGGSGAVGRATAMALAREGARVCLGGRSQRPLEEAATDVERAGGEAETFLVDALDERGAVDAVAKLAERVGGVDIVVNATGFMHDQGRDIAALSLDDFLHCITPALSAYFNIAKACAPHMGEKRPGVILTIVAPAGPMAVPGHLGHIVACAGVEAFTRGLAAELGPRNVRVVCLRSHAISDAIAAGSHTRELFAPKAAAMGIGVEQWVSGAAASTLVSRLPTLSEIAETITFLASENAAAMTGAVVNLTGGATT